MLKNPELSLVIKDIDDLLPKAVLLATVRDPRDQICSEIQVAKRQQVENGLPPESAERNVANLTYNYNLYFKEILEIYSEEPERIHIIRYEDLVQNTGEVLELLKNKTGLNLKFKPDKSWQRVTEFASLHEGPSQSDLFGNPVSSSSLGRYQQELSQEEIDTIETNCSQIISLFGYK